MKEAGKTYTKSVGKFRNKMFGLLYRLAEKGCGDGGWCQCLMCRVMRIVQTERWRNKPIHKSSFPSPDQSATTHTRMVHWRGGLIEFAQNCREDIAGPPWYAIKLTHRKGDDRQWYYWLDYCGPPQLYLTRKAATARMKQLRKQYTNSYRKYEIVKIAEVVK